MEIEKNACRTTGLNACGATSSRVTMQTVAKVENGHTSTFCPAALLLHLTSSR
jgi:hypothetical protein